MRFSRVKLEATCSPMSQSISGGPLLLPEVVSTPSSFRADLLSREQLLNLFSTDRHKFEDLNFFGVDDGMLEGLKDCFLAGRKYASRWIALPDHFWTTPACLQK